MLEEAHCDSGSGTCQQDQEKTAPRERVEQENGPEREPLTGDECTQEKEKGELDGEESETGPVSGQQRRQGELCQEQEGEHSGEHSPDRRIGRHGGQRSAAEDEWAMNPRVRLAQSR